LRRDLCDNAAMARLPIFGRGAGPFGMAFAMWEIWTRIPPRHRKRLLQQARKHGPRIAKQVYAARKTRR
jgi:hypothetical protein